MSEPAGNEPISDPGPEAEPATASVGKRVLLLVALGVVGLTVAGFLVLPKIKAFFVDASSSCVAEGSLVAGPSGSVPIEHLRVGDEVWSIDPLSGRPVVARIVAIYSARRPCLALRTASGRTLTVTEEHPVYAPDEGRFHPAGRWLEPNAPRVAVVDGGLTPEDVLSCAPLSGVRRVYDLTVDSPYHNFSADGVLVHNKTPYEDPFPIPTED